MIFARCKTLLRAALAVAGLCAAAAAQASFIAAIDQFQITRNGVTIFTDSFSDGLPPPSAPSFAGGGPASYAVLGTTPQPETGGKYFMDSTLGGFTLAGDGTARLRNVNTLLTNINPADPTTGLKSNHTFTVSGLFDLVATPISRDGYGITLKDLTGPAPGVVTAGQAWSIFVGKTGTGAPGIHLILQDYTAGTISLVASSALDFSHEQILLKYDRDNTGSNLAHASWQYYDGGAPTGGPFTLGDATLFQSQLWTRADFFTNQETSVPAPATGLLMLLGLGLLGGLRPRTGEVQPAVANRVRGILMLTRSKIVLAGALLVFAQTSQAMLVPGSTPEETGAGLAPQEFTLLSTAWNLGPNSGRIAAGNPAPGSATWSIMGPGHSDASGFDGGHVGTTSLITVLGAFTQAFIEGVINWALNTWAAVSNFVNLGQVADGGVNAGAPQSLGGHLGDIRVAAWEISSAGVLAHAFQPGTEAQFGPGGTIAGDVHFDVARTWVDDPTDLASDPDFDFHTVMLHEIGHALGLGHSSVAGSVMEPVYAGARRTLHADDIAGIQAIYGASAQAPAPTTLALLALGLAGLFRRRAKR